MVPIKTYTIEEIKHFIIEITSCSFEEIKDDADIDHDLGCTGDDFHELISEYSVKFEVNMHDYLWYFHTYEEGGFNSIGRLFFKPPYERVKHIPVTPTILLDSANYGKWTLIYPEHELPKRRFDILINQILVVLFIIFIFYTCTN